MNKRDPIRTAYCRCRSSARFRGEEWALEYTDFINLWQEAGGIHLRGKKMTDLVMHRIDRSQGWILSNIKISPRQEMKLAGGRPSVR